MESELLKNEVPNAIAQHQSCGVGLVECSTLSLVVTNEALQSMLNAGKLPMLIEQLVPSLKSIAFRT